MQENILVIAPICTEGEVDIKAVHGLMDILVMNIRVCSNVIVKAPLFLSGPEEGEKELWTWPSQLPIENLLQMLTHFDAQSKFVLIPTVSSIRNNYFSIEIKLWDIANEIELYQNAWTGSLLQSVHNLKNCIRPLILAMEQPYVEKAEQAEKWPITNNARALELLLHSIYRINCFQADENKDFNTILSNLEKILEWDPKLDLAAYRLLGFIEDLLQNPLLPGDAYTRSLEILKKLEQNEEFSGEIFLVIATIYHYLEDTKNFLRNLNRAKRKSPNSVEVVLAMGNYYEQTEKLDKALVLYQQYLKRNPHGSHMITHNIGTVYAEMGNLEKAVVYWLQALKKNPSSSGTYINLMNAYFEMQQYGQMWIAFEESLKHPPIPWASYDCWIRNLEKLGDYNPVIGSFRDYMDQHPEDAGVYLYLGLALQKQRQKRQALNIWQQGLKVSQETLFQDFLCQEILSSKISNFETKFVEAGEKKLCKASQKKAWIFCKNVP